VGGSGRDVSGSSLKREGKGEKGGTPHSRHVVYIKEEGGPPVKAGRKKKKRRSLRKSREIAPDLLEKEGGKREKKSAVRSFPWGGGKKRKSPSEKLKPILKQGKGGKGGKTEKSSEGGEEKGPFV